MRNKKVFTLLIFSTFAVAALVYAINSWDTGYIVEHGESKAIYGTGKLCAVVTNFCNKDIFVPTKTPDERNAPGGFWDNHPTCIMMECCEKACLGQLPQDSTPWTVNHVNEWGACDSDLRFHFSTDGEAC